MRRRWILLGTILAAAAVVTGALAWRWAPAGPGPVLTYQRSSLQPELLALIDRQVQAVQSAPKDPRSHAELGLVYEANDLWHEALASYQNARQLQPDEPMWLHHAAVAAQNLAKHSAATEMLREGAERFPHFAPIQHRLGTLLAGRGLVEEAAAAFERTIQRAPDECAGYVGLADLKLRQGAYLEARTLLERAVKLKRPHPSVHYLLGRVYLRLGRSQDSRHHLKLGANTETPFLSDEWGDRLDRYAVSVFKRVQKARRFLAEGKVEEAINWLESILAQHPEEGPALRMLGPVYLNAGQSEEARRVLVKAMQIDDSQVSVHINLAVCYREMQRPDEAIRITDEAIKRFPDVWELHYGRGLAHLALQQFPKAMESLAEAVRLNANDPAVYRTAGLVAARLQRHQAAKMHCKTATVRWPDYMPAYVALARVCATRGEWDEALTAIEHARRLAPQEQAITAMAEQIRRRRAENEANSRERGE